MHAEKTAFLPIGADEAFALITEPDRLRRWMTVSARVDLRAGGEYRWTVVPGHVAAGTFREVEPGRRVVFGFGWEGSHDPEPDASVVTITLEPADGGTLVRLVHDGLTEQQRTNHLEGWNHFFSRLERVAVTGDAGLSDMTQVPPDLNPLTSADATLAVCQQVLRGVSAADLDKPTPCAEFTIAQLVDHLIGSLVGLAGRVGAEITPADSGDVEVRVADAAQQALEAWQKHGLDGTVAFGANEVPASFAASILSLEFLIHAWDFAMATGQKVAVSEQVAAYVLQLAEQVISPDGRARGAFAAAIELSADAAVFDRLIAFSGRAA